MFRGINTISIDVKGRLAIPTKYREALGESIVITIDPDDSCLLLYQLKQWELIESKLQSLPSFNAYARRIQRLLIGHATDTEVDKSGRILLPNLLRDYAFLKRRAVMIGQGSKFEMWDAEIWEQKRKLWLSEESSLLESLPEELKTFFL